MFAEACRRLGVPAGQVLHVGDTIADDIDGARGAGVQAVLLRRQDEAVPDGVTAIPNLSHLPGLLGLE
jgi:putative hydrolase of the HAD superfamily